MSWLKYNFALFISRCYENSEDPDERSFCQGLHCLNLKKKNNNKDS